MVVRAAGPGAGLVRVQGEAGGQPALGALLGVGDHRCQHAAQLVAEGVQRRGVVGDAERVQLAHKHPLVLQLGAQRGQLILGPCKG